MNWSMLPLGLFGILNIFLVFVAPGQAKGAGGAMLVCGHYITSLRGAGFGISEIREFMSIKQPGNDAEQKLTKLLIALERLRVVIAERRAALDRANGLLQEWRGEIEEYQRKP